MRSELAAPTPALAPAPTGIEARAAWAREITTVDYLPHRVLREDRADGSILLRSAHPLGPCARTSADWLHRWAAETPERVAVSERRRDGAGWRDLSYGRLLEQVRAVAAALLHRGLGPTDTIAILSGNGIDHLILSLAAQYVGVPVAPLAEQYALIAEAYPRLAYVLDRVKPRLAFVDDAGRYAGALARPELDGVEIVASHPAGAPRPVTPFAELLAASNDAAVAAAHARVGPDTLAKILFTSGSSSDPKGVRVTQRMMCVNQAQMATALPLYHRRPPQLTDWLPWNHVFGGNHNVNMMLACGGTLTIDHGKPTGAGFATTLRNLADRPGTLSFNVPVGFAMLTEALAADRETRDRIFGETDLMIYAGASLPQDVWEQLEHAFIAARGGLPLMISSWGLTETAPACLVVHEPVGRSGVVGVPLPEVVIKLIPDDGLRCEIRVKGPNVMPGYYDDPARTAAAFDEEGFFITGDAVRFVDPADPDRGLVFDGRVSEDFKLSTGTWVQAGSLRMGVLRALTGLVQDVVVCGHDRGEIGLFVFPAPGAADPGALAHGALADPHLMAEIGERLRGINAAAGGSAKRITRALILAEPPSVEGQEITDKGSLNIRNILQRRADLLDRLYDNEDPALIRV